MVRGDKVDVQPVRAQRLGRGRTDRSDAIGGDAAPAKLVRAVAARDHEPVVGASVDRLVTERLDANQLAEDRFVPERRDAGDELLDA